MFDDQPAEKSFENAVHEDTTSTDTGKDSSVFVASTDDQIPHTSSNAGTTDVENAESAQSTTPSSESRGLSVSK